MSDPFKNGMAWPRQDLFSVTTVLSRPRSDGAPDIDDLDHPVPQTLPIHGGEPVRSLLDAIRLVHRRAGEPSSREVMRRIGRGVLSHTTVNAVLRSPRVPRWEPLRHVVVALGGDVEQFRSLWMKARNAEERGQDTDDPLLAFTTRFVGRTTEVDLLRGLVIEVVGGHGRAVLIEGDPGIGKSYLMRAVSAYAEANGCRTLWASCDELSQAFPLLPLLDTVDASVPEEERISPPVATVFQADATSGERIDLVAGATERLLALIDELCASAPVTLVVDDVQWADTTTVVTLRRLVRMTRRLPLLEDFPKSFEWVSVQAVHAEDFQFGYRA